MYQTMTVLGRTFIYRLKDGAVIPEHHGNLDYQAYLAWVADGHVADHRHAHASADVDGAGLIKKST